MNEQRRETILAECIEQVQAGATAADCLAPYGDEAADLAPLLTIAARLQRVQHFRLSADQRRQAKSTLGAMLSSQNRSVRPTAKATLWHFRLALAGALAIVMLVTVSATLVASSKPGDTAYPVRVVIERAPVLLKATAAAKAATELQIADRRLADVAQYMAATGRLQQDAITALLNGDQATANLEAAASVEERATVAARLRAHAHTLANMAEAATETQTRAALQVAAAQALAIATSLEVGSESRAASPTALPMTWPWPTPTPSEVTLVAEPTSIVSSATATPAYTTATPQATHTRGNGPQPTMASQATHTQGNGPQPTMTPQATRTQGNGPQPTMTPQATRTQDSGPQPTMTPQAIRTQGKGLQPTKTPPATRTQGNNKP